MSPKRSMQVLQFAIVLCFAGAPLLSVPAAAAAHEFVLVSTAPDANNARALRNQLFQWRRLGLVSKVQLFEAEPGQEAQFQLFGILGFTDTVALKLWTEKARASLPEDVHLSEVDRLADLGCSPGDAAKSVFLVMQYDVLVGREAFEDYIDGYQLPEMHARKALGGLVRYTSFLARPGSSAPWQSLLILEYKDSSAYVESEEVNKSAGEQLARQDARFRAFKETKNSIRTKTATTRAHWVELSSSASIESNP